MVGSGWFGREGEREGRGRYRHAATAAAAAACHLRLRLAPPHRCVLLLRLLLPAAVLPPVASVPIQPHPHHSLVHLNRPDRSTTFSLSISTPRHATAAAPFHLSPHCIISV